MSIRNQLEAVTIKPNVKAAKLAGVDIYVRKLSWGELRRVQALDDPAKQVCAVMCDSDGNQVYGEDESNLLDKFNPEDLKAVLDVATSFNSLDEQVRAAKNV